MSKSIVLFLLLFSMTSFGQEEYTLDVKGDLREVTNKTKSHFSDSLELTTYLSQLRDLALKKGFLTASIDSIRFSSTNVMAFFHRGPRFQSIEIDANEDDIQFLRRHSNLNERLLSDISFKPIEVATLLNKTRDAFTNNGYPFCSVNLEDIQFSYSSSARLNIDRGSYYSISAVKVRGDSSIHVKSICNVLNIQVGDPHNENRIKKVYDRLEQLRYLEQIKPPELLFTEEGTELYLYLKKRKTSSINGVVGLQPDPIAERVVVTGDLNLSLLNALNRGELLDIRWQSIRAQTQNLEMKLEYPYIFNTRFGINSTFNLYKRDTTFLETDLKFEVDYYLSSNTRIKGYYQNYLSTDLSGAKNNNLFTDVGRTTTNMYGVGFSHSQLDYLQNPRKGLQINIEGALGNRSLQRSDTIPTESSLSYRGLSSINVFVPIWKRHILRLANTTRFLGADAQLVENELFRFGGLNSQRGFNEDEFFASVHVSSTVEYRFLLDKNSHLLAFFDYSWYEKATSSYIADDPFGFGIGFSFSTNLGLFSINYALGQQLANPIRFSEGKVHFGYITYF